MLLIKSIFLRFVDGSDTIREEFLDFVTVDKTAGEVLAKNTGNNEHIMVLILLLSWRDMTMPPTCLGLQLCKGD